tara:strand:- start:3143 stop:3652 length:510 start_codon:yes stop_codon:yes gene_type:complete
LKKKEENPMKPNGWRGYVTSRPFGGLHIPVPVQNLILRDFTSRNKLQYKLPPNEFVMQGCYMQLEGILEELPRLEGLVMSSIFMLPVDRKKRHAIFEAIFNTGAKVGFALEDIILSSIEETIDIENNLSSYHLLEECPQTVALGLPPFPHLQKVPGWTSPAGDDWNPGN